MANYGDSIIHITTKSQKLKALLKHCYETFKSSEGNDEFVHELFDTLRPLGENHSDQIAYDLWGCSYGCRIWLIEIEEKADSTLHFNLTVETAWTPPIELMDFLCKDYDDTEITLYWLEESGDFLSFENGKVSDTENIYSLKFDAPETVEKLAFLSYHMGIDVWEYFSDYTDNLGNPISDDDLNELCDKVNAYLDTKPFEKT